MAAGSLQTIEAIKELTLSKRNPRNITNLTQELQDLEKKQSTIKLKLFDIYRRIPRNSEAVPGLFRLNCFFSAVFSLSMIVFAGMSAHVKAGTPQSVPICYNLFYIAFDFFVLTCLVYILDFFPLKENARKIIGFLFLVILTFVVIRFFSVPINNNATIIDFAASKYDIAKSPFFYMHILLYPIFPYLLYFLKNQFIIPTFYALTLLPVGLHFRELEKGAVAINALWEASRNDELHIAHPHLHNMDTDT